MNRLAVLSNPGSGRNRVAEARFASLAGLSGVDHRLTGARDALPELVESVLATRPAALAVNGGDGTLQSVLTVLLERGRCEDLPALVALPGGSTNMSARDLGSGGSLQHALRAFLALRDRSRDDWPVQWRSVLEVREDDGGFHAGLFFGLGTIVRGARYWKQQLGAARRTGELAAGLAFARGAWGILRRQPPFADGTRVALGFGAPGIGAPGVGRVGCEPDGDQDTVQVSLLLVTVMRRLFLGMTPFWGSGDAPLACTWLDDPPRRLIRRLPALVRGRGEAMHPHEGYHSRRAHRVRLAFDDDWLLDGELHRSAGSLTLSASEALPFLDLGRGRS